MPIKIASWNCSLGLVNKKDIVQNILHDYKIDILFIQEAEIKTSTPIQFLQIQDYNLETSPTYGQKNSRTCCYIRSKLKYDRVLDKENKNVEAMLIKVFDYTICGLYRPFLLPNHQNDISYLDDIKTMIENIQSKNIILIGDFNMDYKKVSDQTYRNTRLYNIIEPVLIEKTLVQLITEPTWKRKSGNELKESILDHIYVSNLCSVQNHFNEQQIVGDHNLIGLDLQLEQIKYPMNYPKHVQDWSDYNKEKLVNRLLMYDFDKLENSDVNSHNSELNQLLCTIADELIPTLTIKRKEVPGFVSIDYIKRRRKRKNYYKRFKSTGDERLLHKAKNLEKLLKKDINKLRKKKIRSKIKPNDSKSLWQAVNLSMNIVSESLPEKIYCDDEEADDDQKKADLFCKFFNEKTNNIIKNNPHNRNVFNGRKLIENTQINEFTLEELNKVLDFLPSKNCSGIDRIPLRFFKDGKEALASTILSLMNKIWQTETIPEIWKITKTIPLHKSGNKSRVENYRPISNLCSLSKIFEKLIQIKLDKIASNNNIDLTNPKQHGFKKKHSTITAMLEIQNRIATALDNDEYAAIISLDLSAAFDVVDHKLLIKRLRILNLPEKIVTLLSEWLKNRHMFVDVNSSCSIFTEILAGTLQGSCLGPVLFALFVSPMYVHSDCITYADDNYTVETGKNIDETLGKVRMKAESLMTWLKDSGMQVNSKKTEFCIFNRNDVATKTIKLLDENVESKKEIRILGVTFDTKLSWSSHINLMILKCKKTLQAIKLIAKNFTIDEKINIITSLFYSRMYYGAEVWLIPTLKHNLKKKILSLSTQALRVASEDIYKTFNGDELHFLLKRFSLLKCKTILAY